MANRSMSGAATKTFDDVVTLRQLPPLIGMLFGVLSAWTFGGLVGPITVGWGVDYTLTTNHAIVGSLVAFVLAFASSQTREWKNYAGWEKVVIGAGVALIPAYPHWAWLQDQFAVYDPLASVLGFVLTVIAFGLATR